MVIIVLLYAQYSDDRITLFTGHMNILVSFPLKRTMTPRLYNNRISLKNIYNAFYPPCVMQLKAGFPRSAVAMEETL
jgi:hypothetical protein